MSGLFSGFLLDSIGFHNYEIIEANDRLGGQVVCHQCCNIKKCANIVYFLQSCPYPLLWKAQLIQISGNGLADIHFDDYIQASSKANLNLAFRSNALPSRLDLQ
jgi:hypothetical protein